MSCKVHEDTITTIRYMDVDGEYVYIKNAVDFGEDLSWSFGVAYEREEADDISELSVEDQVNLFIVFQEYYSNMECELVKLMIRIESKDLLTDSDLLKEARQRIALNKLNDRDIKALNLGSIATYIKTKYA